MSLTPKSVVRFAKSCRPCVDPIEVKTTGTPFGVTSATHWLSALAAQEEPDPVIWVWLGPFAAAGVALESTTRAATALAAANGRVKRLILGSSGCGATSAHPWPGDHAGDDEQHQDENEQHA